MSSTCLDLHSAADVTVAHVSVRSHREHECVSAVQVVEPAVGVGGVALHGHFHAAGGSSQVELHSFVFLPEHVGRAVPTLLVYCNMQRFTGSCTTCRVNIRDQFPQLQLRRD